MKEKIKKILTLIEALLILVSIAFFYVFFITTLIKEGSENVNFLPAIIYLTFGGMSILICLSMFQFYKKHDSDFLQSGYDYIFNCIAISQLISCSFYYININDSYFIRIENDPNYILSIIVLLVGYIVLYGIFFKYKFFKLFRFVPYLALIICIVLFININLDPYLISSCVLMMICILIAIIKSFLITKTKNNQTKEENNTSEN